MSKAYVVGIDLGTTNSVVAYGSLGSEIPTIRLLPIPQLVEAGTVEAREALPSFLYLANAAERPSSAFDVPWGNERDFACGEWARRRAADFPLATVSAAKSWLCHPRVDRHAAILPWGAPDEQSKLSPVTATQRYLEHLTAAWNAAFPDAPLADQIVLLTVPASFDPVARELTRESAIAAGFPQDFTLLEEPQAAVYAWLEAMGDRWRSLVRPNESILVVDVGGGTTDLTLIRVDEEEGELSLRRVAVGNHLLVGGDNMDLALAHLVADMFASQGVKLDPWQSVSLWHSCRAAKESLLSRGGPERQSISVLGRGSRLIGGTVSVEVEREAIAEFLTGGFLPRCELRDRPTRRRASGLQEMGLPYEADPAITRHIAAFLGTHGSAAEGPPLPTHVLFNGGVFQSDRLRERLVEVLASWGGDGSGTRVLAGEHDLRFAVARGAAYYGWSREHRGIRIRGGTARTLYVGIETTGLAIPGAPRPLRALCIAPFGMEEGSEIDVPSHEVGLVVGEPVQFRFFSSTTRNVDAAGTLLDRWDDEELTEHAPLETVLPAAAGGDESYVPVRFQSRITELGMLELWCVSTQSPARWKLEFNVREGAESHP